MVTFVAIFGFGGFLLTLLIELSEDGYTRRDMLFHPPLLGLLAAAFAVGLWVFGGSLISTPPTCERFGIESRGKCLTDVKHDIWSEEQEYLRRG